MAGEKEVAAAQVAKAAEQMGRMEGQMAEMAKALAALQKAAAEAEPEPEPEPSQGGAAGPREGVPPQRLAFTHHHSEVQLSESGTHPSSSSRRLHFSAPDPCFSFSSRLPFKTLLKLLSNLFYDFFVKSNSPFQSILP